MKKSQLILHLLFGGLFIYAGIVKAADPQSFLDDVRSFDLLRDPWSAWLAMGLPWLEIFAGLAVVTGFFRPGGLLVLNAALIAFLGAIGIAWYRGIDIRCGCFGASAATSDYLSLLARDLVLLALGLWLAWRARANQPQQSNGHLGIE
ncbi:MAG: DoxX family membrane protein [Verrucomicrobiaceae bacterium]|nr:DoxX family membrane protein [Verrucomicrobiaceae bacterium]